MSLDTKRCYVFPSRSKLNHREHHAYLHNWVQDCICTNRVGLGVDTSWHIEVRICCQEEMNHSEGAIAWHQDAQKAYMHLRCDMWPALLEWVVLHELIELRRGHEADLFLKTLSYLEHNKMLHDHLFETYITMRNQDIEREITHYMGYRRPGHLVNSLDRETNALVEMSPSEISTLVLLPAYHP